MSACPRPCPRIPGRRSRRSPALAPAWVAALASWGALLALPGAGAAQAPDSAALSSALAGLEYRDIGPALMGGRISALAVVESRPQHFFVGTGSGGLWKTENHGTSWTPLFDDQPTASIGDVAVDQTNPNLVWVGTGEPQNRQSSPWGNGVYKSTDGGRSWRHMGLAETKHVGRVLIHPTDPEVVYVAAVGDLWAPNPERGVYRTRDGGESWELVLSVDEDTGAIDLAMDPNDPRTLFAAMYQRRRTGFGFNGGGPGSGLYRTVDGGESWTELTQGLPPGDKGRIGVDVHRGDGNLVYALIEADARSVDPEAGSGSSGGTGLYRSTDRGESWEKVSDTNPRPMYYSQVRIDPTNPDRIYVLGTRLLVSDDGGRSFRNDGAVQIHVDHHDLWIDPADPDHLILGSDGGVSASWDGTAHWRMFDNLALGQFYTIAYDMRDPYYICGGLQDNDPWCGPSNTRSFHGIRHQDWYETAYGDGFWTVVDPTDSTIVFSESQGGNMNRYDLVTGEKTPMRPIVGPRERGDTTKEYRFNWNSPLLISRHDPATIYLGANYLMRSRDRGMSWEEVGGVDLTRGIDRDTLTIMGVPGSEPMMSIHDGIATYGNLTVFAESRFTPEVLWAGTDDGNVQLSRDGGATWTNVVDRIPELPDRTYVSRITPSAHDPARVYATFDGHRNGDYAPYAYISEDLGESWERIDEGLPHGWSVNVITEHHRAPDLLFVGNEIGVFVSVDRGESWQRLKADLPTVPVDDLAIHPRENDLIVGTHGRSAWILDDLGPLEALATERDLLARAAAVFPMKRSIMWAQKGDWPFYGATYSAPNPPRAVRVRYWLRENAEPDPEGPGTLDGARAGEGSPEAGAGEPSPSAEGGGAAAPRARTVELVVLDATGTPVRRLEGPGEAGLHEILWDWRHDPPYPVPDGDADAPRPPQGPVVLPGTYTVRLDLGGEVDEAEVVLEADPRRPMSPADRAARQEALMALHRLAEPLMEAERGVRRLTGQMAEAADLLGGRQDLPAALATEAEAIQEELETIEAGLEEVRRWTGVASGIQGSSTRPTEDQLWQIDAAWEAMPDWTSRLNALITNRVPAFYLSLDAEGVRPEPGPPVTLPRRGGGG